MLFAILDFYISTLLQRLIVVLISLPGLQSSVK